MALGVHAVVGARGACAWRSRAGHRTIPAGAAAVSGLPCAVGRQPPVRITGSSMSSLHVCHVDEVRILVDDSRGAVRACTVVWTRRAAGGRSAAAHRAPQPRSRLARFRARRWRSCSDGIEFVERARPKAVIDQPGAARGQRPGVRCCRTRRSAAGARGPHGDALTVELLSLRQRRGQVLGQGRTRTSRASAGWSKRKGAGIQA